MKRTRLRLAAAAIVLATAASFVNTSSQVRSRSIQNTGSSSFRSSRGLRDSSSAFAQAISNRGSASPHSRSSSSRGHCSTGTISMCRLMVFKGDAVPLSDLLYHPTNSLINQSHTQRRSSLIPGLPESLHMALNIDGCGLALRELSKQAHSNLIFGHVRSASAGVTGEQAAAVGESNCHPFSYRGLSFMHNGTCNCVRTQCFERFFMYTKSHVRIHTHTAH
jgi:hypothetical protein